MKKNFEQLKKDFVETWRYFYEGKDCEALAGGTKYTSLDLMTQFENNQNDYEIDFEDEDIEKEINEIESSLYSHEDIDFYDFLRCLDINRDDLLEIDETIEYSEDGIEKYDNNKIDEIIDFIEEKYDKCIYCIQYETLFNNYETYDKFVGFIYNNFIINEFGNIDYDANY